MLSLGEGNTPLESDDWLASWAGTGALSLKREDQNPTGSLKDRGARAQLEGCLARGDRVAVISSSGNAALAAATYGMAAGVAVVALLSPMTEAGRVSQIRKAGARVIVTTKPINFTIRLARVKGWPDLRPSQSPEAVAGFRTLGEELAREVPEGAQVFGYASSGTAFQAIGEVFKEEGKRMALNPVQAGLVNGLSRAFGRPGDGRRSVVGDLGVKVSSRADDVIRLVRASGGQAWWAADEQVNRAREALRQRGYAVAAECWAALAGLKIAATEAGGLEQACLLLTGRATAVDGDGAVVERPGDAGEDLGGHGRADLGTLAKPATEFRQVLDLVEDLG